jgi:tRNA modification GTPase
LLLAAFHFRKTLSGKFINEKNMSENINETIYALATPPGRSAIAVIRISGLKAAKAPALFSVSCPAAGHFGISRLMQDGKVLDQVILLFMKGPRSSTGEDVCEIHCHGGRAVIEAIMATLATASGYRLASPGEFTRRSLLNGKMDLSGVEGLADLIDAQTPSQLHQAWAQIDGALRAPVMAWRAELIDIIAQLEALIDFNEEDLPSAIEEGLRRGTKTLIKALAENLDDGGIGELVRDGVVLVLVGPVNAGKSTILNELAGRAAAIVSDEAGTTRDIIQIQLDLGGIPTTILDTAGIRETNGAIESEGIKRAIAAAANADLLMIILDGSDQHWPDARAEIDKAIGHGVNGTVKSSEAISVKSVSGCRRLYVLNKADRGIDRTNYRGDYNDNNIDNHDMLVISAKNPSDISALKTALVTRLVPLNHAEGSVIITRQRHRQAIQVAYDALGRALTHDFQHAPELAAEDFRLGASALGRITGEIDVEELLGSIFSSFCIGK